MLEDLILWGLTTFWKFLTMVLTGLFTKQSIPVVIFFVTAVLFYFFFFYCHLKGKNPKLKTWMLRIGNYSLGLSLITVGVFSWGLAVDTINQHVNVLPTDDYVIVGIGENIGGVNLNLCPIDEYHEGLADSTGNKAWRKTRFAHFITEQITDFQPRIGMEVSVATIGDDMRVFKKLKPLPGDEDESDADHQPALGMITP